MLKKLNKKIKIHIAVHALIESVKTTAVLFTFYIVLPVLAVIIWVLGGQP